MHADICSPQVCAYTAFVGYSAVTWHCLHKLSCALCSSSCGIRAQAMELVGECRLKGATRLIEDLEHADLGQHPRDKLPGEGPYILIPTNQCQNLSVNQGTACKAAWHYCMSFMSEGN